MNYISLLSEKLVMEEEELVKFTLTMPRRYKKYFIPKRNGLGVRLIAQPSKEVKFIQRLLVDELRKTLPIHPAAMAYEKGVGIRANASVHMDSRYLLKMDFKEFFPSITPNLFFSVAEKCGVHFEQHDKTFLENSLFWKRTRRSILRLSIGAPSSPFVSNFIMFNFDKSMAEFCAKNKINYTRYADDLTFTTNEKGILFDLPKIVTGILKKDCFGKIKVNALKTVFSSKAFNRHVTGIVINNENKLSIGRNRKREISSMIHRFSLSRIDEDQRLKLKGLIAFSMHIEPEFLERMKSKYSSEVIELILK